MTRVPKRLLPWLVGALMASAIGAGLWVLGTLRDEPPTSLRAGAEVAGPPADVPVDPVEAGDAHMRLRPEATALLLDVATGQPVAQLSVEFDDGGRHRLVRQSGADGCVTVPVGSWRVRSQSDAWLADSREWELSAADQPTPIWLVRRLTLEVFVAAPSGEPIAGASVRWQADRLAEDAPGARGGAAEVDGICEIADGRGMARFPGWQHRPGTLTAAADGHEPVAVAIGGPAPPSPVHVVLCEATPKPPHVQFRGLGPTGELAAGLRLRTACGRLVQCDAQGRLPLDSGLLRELPLHVVAGQEWYPVAIPRLQSGGVVALPRSARTRITIVGGRPELGFAVHLLYRPETSHGFAVDPREWHFEAREVDMELPEAVTSHLGGADGGVAQGLTEVLPTPEHRHFSLVLAESPVLAIRLLREGHPVAVRGHATYALEPQDWSSEWRQIYRPDGDGWLAIPRPALLSGVEVGDGAWSVRLRRAKPGPTKDQDVAAALELELGPLHGVRCVIASGGSRPPAGLALRLWPVDRDGVPTAQSATAHPAWVRSAPLAQTFAIGHAGNCAPRLTPGWYHAELVSSGPGGRPLVKLAEVVEFPWPAGRRFDFPGVVWRDVEVASASGPSVIPAFKIQSEDGWRVAVHGRRWSGWTPAVGLTLHAEGVGSAQIAAEVTGPVRIELGARLACLVNLHGMPTAYTAVVAVIMRNDGRGEVVTLPKSAFDSAGRLHVPVEDGLRFRIEVQTEQDVWSTQELVARPGAEYGVSLSLR